MFAGLRSRWIRQAGDASAVLRQLGVPRAHIAGHSYGAIIALQLAMDAPDLVHSLVLLELPLLSAPSGQKLIEAMAPAIERYQSGDGAGAVDAFLRIVGGPEWRNDVARTVPHGPEQSETDVRTFFEVEMPALAGWKFDAHVAKQVSPFARVLREVEHAVHLVRVPAVSTDLEPLLHEGVSDEVLAEQRGSDIRADLPGVLA
jgi:pimeloyl-ACP methyl ester carboxylesterase